MATLIDQTAISAAGTTAAGPGSAAAWRRIVLIILIAALACGVVAWVAYGRQAATQQPATPAAPRPAFSPPAIVSPGLARGLDENEEIITDAAPTRSSGLAWPMWEFRLRLPIPPRDPSLTPLTWRLIGSSLTNGTWSVIVLRQGSTAPEYFTVGQELPGGYRIEAINDEDVTLAHGKRSMVLSYIGSR